MQLNRAITYNSRLSNDRVNKIIVWLTLIGLVTASLSFSVFEVVAVFNEPKVVALHLISGLIAILWAWQAAIGRVQAPSLNDSKTSWDLAGWVGRDPARWALICVAIWVFAQIASTILSPLPIISFFGGDEARSGYNLYDSLSLTVLLVSVALRFRSRESLDLLIYTLVITGATAAAYGIAQHFGWDPLGGNAGRTRVISSFGNTLNFGGYMVMSIPATLALAYKRPSNWWIWIAMVAVALTLQLTGLWFSGGRGPFVSAFASIATFFLICVAVLPIKKVALALMILIFCSVAAVGIAAIPSEQGDVGLQRIKSLGTQFSTNSSSTDIEGGLDGRFNIWGSSLKIVTGWDLPIKEPAANRLLRPVFGLGPDMYVYSFPLVGKPQSGLALVDHTHNYTLQILMEQGFAGLTAFVGLSTLIVIMSVRLTLMFRSRGAGLDPLAILLLALAPATIGKLVEMQSGVARVSDLAMNMALFGGVIALYEIAGRTLASDSEPQPRTRARSVYALTAPSQTLVGANLLAAIVVTVALISIFISWDMRRLTASHALAIGYDSPSQEERALLWANVQSRVPERESFTFTLFEEYDEAARQQHELGNKDEALRLMLFGRDMLLEYEQRDPLELDTQTGLLKTASTLIAWGHNEYAQELADRAIRMAEANPAYPTILGTSATALTSVGLHELAIEYADMAIATEQTTQPWSKAWYAKGRALIELNRDDEAIAVLTTATEKQPGAEGALLSHQLLAILYLQRGDTEAYERHLELSNGEITITE
tara:strand:- start:203 stop:2512 length:2310 start_codon:yes stop_codon:yes gene_type:complete